MKVDEGVHPWKAWSGLILEELCHQTAYEVIQPEETSAVELTGQQQKESYQNICVAHLPMEAEDAVPVESQGFEQLACHLLRISKLIYIN